MNHIFWFLTWTLMIYFIHRIGHVIPIIRDIHGKHHRYISEHNITGWTWKNLFFYQDNLFSTLDVFITEVIPTIIFCYLTGEWWLFGFFYVWSATIQECIEHSPNFDMYPYLTSGKWHLRHHLKGKCNYGIFTPIWDILFGTNEALK